MKRLGQRAWSAIAFASVMALAASASAQSESAGVAQYFNNCASCHESTDPGHQAPKTSVLKQMTPERILEIMTTGSMRNMAATLSDADKRLIAEWVGGRKLDADAKARVYAGLTPFDPVTHLPKVKARAVLLQFAKKDPYVTQEAADALIASVTAPKESKFYDTGHEMNREALDDRVAWLVRVLGRQAASPCQASAAGGSRSPRLRGRCRDGSGSRAGWR